MGTVALTLAAYALAIGSAPAAGADPARALTWLLFIGSSAHVASTGWFSFLPQVRGYARTRPRRYLIAPAALVAGTALVAAVLAPQRFVWLLLVFFAWQFFHFQKQNLGLAALAGVSHGVGSLDGTERGAIMATGIAGIAGLLWHPELLQLGVRPPLRLGFSLAGAAFALGVAFGLWCLGRRPRSQRPAPFVVVYLMGLLFFAPVFLFRSPYAAVAGLTIAHGLQYLLLMGFVAGGGPTGHRRTISLAVLVNATLLGGLALNAASHLHDAQPVGRALFGAYLGVVMAHFVIDAGIWRLRDSFPRQMLTARVPYLLKPVR